MPPKRRRGLQSEVNMAEPLDVAPSIMGPLQEPPRVPDRLLPKGPEKPPEPTNDAEPASVAEPPPITSALHGIESPTQSDTPPTRQAAGQALGSSTCAARYQAPRRAVSGAEGRVPHGAVHVHEDAVDVGARRCRASRS